MKKEYYMFSETDFDKDYHEKIAFAVEAVDGKVVKSYECTTCLSETGKIENKIGMFDYILNNRPIDEVLQEYGNWDGMKITEISENEWKKIVAEREKIEENAQKISEGANKTRERIRARKSQREDPLAAKEKALEAASPLRVRKGNGVDAKTAKDKARLRIYKKLSSEKLQQMKQQGVER